MDPSLMVTKQEISRMKVLLMGGCLHLLLVPSLVPDGYCLMLVV